MALPCGAPQFMGRTFQRPNPIIVTKNMTFQELMKLLQGRPENPVYLLTDDCESSAWLQKLLKSSAERGDLSPQGLKDACSNWPLFANWSSQCWELISSFLKKGMDLIKTDQLCLVTSVGLASSASASDNQPNQTTTSDQPDLDPGPYNGHCFNVARLKQDDGAPHCFIVEGTASMVPIKLSSASPTVTCQLWQMTSSQMQTTKLDMAQFMTILSKTFVSLTQVITSPNGGQNLSTGWPLGNCCMSYLLFIYHLLIMNDSQMNLYLAGLQAR